MMPGRRYSEGLHQALEAKEHQPVQPENQTLASITFQNYFRMYEKLAGMTGTAATEADELFDIYKLEEVEIPTNVAVARLDEDDEVYRTQKEKYAAILAEVERANARLQPALVGTAWIEQIKADVERFRDLVLKAEDIIEVEPAKGGKPAKTVNRPGGLYIIGSERHESRRIDNQLRGRSGRQGDPGRSKFFLSLEDDLMRIFGSDRLDTMLTRLGLKEGEAIIHPWINKALEKAQQKVEARNFDIRKNLLKFDNV